MRKSILFFVLILCNSFISHIAYSQRTNCENDWCWGENPKKAKEMYALFADGLPLKDFKNSEKAFDWLIAEVPNLNKELYIKGESLYIALKRHEKNLGNNTATINKYNNKIEEIKKLRKKYFPS